MKGRKGRGRREGRRKERGGITPHREILDPPLSTAIRIVATYLNDCVHAKEFAVMCGTDLAKTASFSVQVDLGWIVFFIHFEPLNQ